MTPDEFAERIVAVQDTLYRVSTAILPQLCDREDAVQAAVEKALRKRDRLRSDQALEAWMIRILINECYTLLRRRRWEEPQNELPEREVLPDADPNLYKLFTTLNEKYRLPMVLHYVEGYDVREISAMLRLPVGTLKSRLFRGRRCLRDILDDEEVY